MGLFETFDKTSHQEWLDKIIIDLKGKDFNDTLVWNSDEGIQVQPFYDSSSIHSSSSPIKKSKGWKIRETITIQSFEEANKKALIALKGGANALLFIGEIRTQEEMNQLLNTIQTDIIDVHFYHPNPINISNLVALKHGSISYDYLGAYLSGNNIDLESGINDLARLTTTHSETKSITINGNYYSNNGYNIIQEVALSLSQAVEYFNLLTNKGIDPTIIASKTQFTFGISTNYFFEIAKLRAARKLWNLILEQYEVEDKTMTIHAETSIEQSNHEDINYNMLRNTTKAMSAIIGGCDSLTVLPHDNSVETIEFSNRIARNIQHVLKEEAFFDKVNNPADGAYYIEELTEEIAKRVWSVFQEIETKGGFISSIENGYIKNELKSVVNA